ncbi:uncharacterised protein [Saccharolobus solfataricus]|uniref:Uncharacterized protein n=2 Tax=Saccharolobus solfataricus TaxID=2287 RepID=A0A157T2F4_SACSO|nr:uncharacterised protein [Saccharolobus solfataricus]
MSVVRLVNSTSYEVMKMKVKLVSCLRGGEKVTDSIKDRILNKFFY